MKRKITVVTSAYRSEQYLLGYFENMLRLTNRSEIAIALLLNDPTSKEREISTAYQSRNPDLFQVQCTERETIGASLNRGFRAADTPYVAYADVDDRRPPDAFSKQLATLEANPDADFTYGDFIVVKKAEQTEGWPVATPEFDPLEFTRSSCVGPGHFFRKTLLDRTGYFDEQLKSGADYDFQIRAAFNCRFKKTAAVVAYYLMDSRLPSASKTPWQQIDLCAISMRYGLFDRLNYDHLASATYYRIFEVQYNGTWVPVRQLVPNYEMAMQQRRSEWAQLGLKKYLDEKRFAGKIKSLLRKFARKTRQDGWMEAVHTAYRHLEARVK